MTIITSNAQTDGRGRFNRTWISPNGVNVYMTICFFLKKESALQAKLSNISQVIAISIVEALEELGFEPKLKWPNDLLLSHKKVGGILSETTSVDNQICFIGGIGVNVNMPLELLQQINQAATSLFNETGTKLDVSQVIFLIQKYFISNLKKFTQHGFAPFLEKYKKSLVHNYGDRIQLRDSLISLEGDFNSIADDGTLILKLENGEIKKFYSGEIV